VFCIARIDLLVHRLTATTKTIQEPFFTSKEINYIPRINNCLLQANLIFFFFGKKQKTKRKHHLQRYRLISVQLNMIGNQVFNLKK